MTTQFLDGYIVMLFEVITSHSTNSWIIWKKMIEVQNDKHMFT